MKGSIRKSTIKKEKLNKAKVLEAKRNKAKEKLDQLNRNRSIKLSKVKNNITASTGGISINKKFFNPNQKLGSCLISFFGISFSKAFLACSNFGLTFGIKIKRIPLYKLKFLSLFVEKNFISERELKKRYKSSLLHNITVGNYKGLRYNQGLPTNGQRSHTNRKTIKRLSMSPSFYLSCKNLASKI